MRIYQVSYLDLNIPLLCLQLKYCSTLLVLENLKVTSVILSSYSLWTKCRKQVYDWRADVLKILDLPTCSCHLTRSFLKKVTPKNHTTEEMCCVDWFRAETNFFWNHWSLSVDSFGSWIRRLRNNSPDVSEEAWNRYSSVAVSIAV